jgi:hypothetical protein
MRTLLQEAARIPGNHPEAMARVAGMPRDLDWREVRRYKPRRNRGRLAIVSVMRLPCVGWRIEVPDIAVSLTTGSDMDDVTEVVAAGFASGEIHVLFRDGIPFALVYGPRMMDERRHLTVERAFDDDMLAFDGAEDDVDA